MSLFVYADESGVFDRSNGSYFVFGGLIFLSSSQRDNYRRKYLAAERAIRAKEKATVNGELKASILSPGDKASLFRSLNAIDRFAAVVNLSRVNENIFAHKKSKQRYLDYAFKISLKRALESMIREGRVSAEYAECLYVLMDEHTTATNGRYELQEALDMEFRTGTYNFNWQKFHPPIFPRLQNVDFKMRDSQADPMIRGADIVANKVFFHARTGRLAELNNRVRYTILP